MLEFKWGVGVGVGVGIRQWDIEEEDLTQTSWSMDGGEGPSIRLIWSWALLYDTKLKDIGFYYVKIRVHVI